MNGRKSPSNGPPCGGLPVVAAGYAQKFKMAEPSDNSCWSSSEDDYSDPLEEADSARATILARTLGT